MFCREKLRFISPLTTQQRTLESHRTYHPRSEGKQQRPVKTQRPNVCRGHHPLPSPNRQPVARSAQRVRRLERRLLSFSPLRKNRHLEGESGDISKASTTSLCAICSSIPPPCERISTPRAEVNKSKQWEDLAAA